MERVGQVLPASPLLPGTPVLAGQDREAVTRGLGVSRIDFKLSGQGNTGPLILENIFHHKGGPAKHLHHEQDEWFYIIKGQFVLQVGEQQFALSKGDSLFAPRQVPHVWAHTGDGEGQILISFYPAGLMEDFFREVTKHNAMPARDPALWQAHGMELLGPPLPV